MKRLFILSLFAFLSTFSLMAVTFTPETVPNPRNTDATAFVCNPDGIIAPEQVEQLQRISEQVDSLSEVELVVVAVKDIGDADGFDFALKLFNLWGIGDKEKNTGVLLFLTTDSRQVQIITGASIEGIMTDAQCSRTLDEMIDTLKANHFAEGLIIGAKSIARKVTAEDALPELLFGTKYPEPSGAPWNVFSWLLGLGLAGYGTREYAKKQSIKPCPKCTKRTTVMVKREVVKESTQDEDGQGLTYYKCENCGHEFTLPYTIYRKRDGGAFAAGGALGGFSGGGRFRGGGFGGSFGGGHSLGGGAGRRF